MFIQNRALCQTLRHLVTPSFVSDTGDNAQHHANGQNRPRYTACTATQAKALNTAQQTPQFLPAPSEWLGPPACVASFTKAFPRDA